MDVDEGAGARPRSLLLAGILLLLIAALFCARNLPWTFERFDQASHAFAGWSVFHEGCWIVPRVQSGHPALKPPLATWCYALLHGLTGEWQLACRLPSLVAAYIILLILWREDSRGGKRLSLGAAAFGLNLFSIRLATLIDTNMLIAFWVFLAGWLVYQRLALDRPWTVSSRLVLALCLTGGLMTKGPINYAFLLPGMVAFTLLSRDRAAARAVWSGWWCWLAPLVVLLTWVFAACGSDPDFFERVVLQEFLGRVTPGLESAHKAQTVYFYVGHFFLKFAPWTLLIAGAALPAPNLRKQAWVDPAARWLICWAACGFIMISLIPSKRPDRVFPIIPPLCLLISRMTPRRESVSRWQTPENLAFGVAILFVGGYTASEVLHGYREHDDELVLFTRRVKDAPAGHSFLLVDSPDWGLSVYLDQARAPKLEAAVKLWNAGKADSAVCPLEDVSRFVGAKTVLLSEAREKCPYRYAFIRR